MDKDDWQGGRGGRRCSAATPLRAPILLSDGGDLPAVTDEHARSGSSRRAADLDQGRAGRPGRAASRPRRTASRRRRSTGERPVRARRRDRPLPRRADGQAVRRRDRHDRRARRRTRCPPPPGPRAPATPVLFVKANEVPAPTTAGARAATRSPNIYVLGPTTVVSRGGGEGARPARRRVTRIEGPNPVENAIAFAALPVTGNFGWGAERARPQLHAREHVAAARRRRRRRARRQRHVRAAAPDRPGRPAPAPLDELPARRPARASSGDPSARRLQPRLDPRRRGRRSRSSGAGPHRRESPQLVPVQVETCPAASRRSSARMSEYERPATASGASRPWRTCASSWAPRPRTSRCSSATGSAT